MKKLIDMLVLSDKGVCLLLSENSKAFLGVGWKFPVQTNNNLIIQLSEYEQNIKESILIIFGTAKGERVMHADFGCGIHNFVFEVINASILGRIEISVREVLTLSGTEGSF